MPYLHIFNPENDFALALGRRAFTPDKGALAIRRAGQLLPLWWASEGDRVLVENDADILRRAEQMIRTHNLPARVTTVIDPALKPSPWGWSHHTRQMLLKAGADARLLPSDSWLDNLRDLSHRHTAVRIARLIGVEAHLIPIEATSTDEAWRAIRRFKTDAVVKLPWSSSGRGVIYTNAYSESTLAGYIVGMIRRQGSVTIEPRYNRMRDFAMLFSSSEGGDRVVYEGLSSFLTDNRGFYAGNIVASQDTISRHIGLDTSHLIVPLCRALREVTAPVGYEGPIGVDMLIYKESGDEIRIAPCIEVNFRRTMGFAALSAARRIAPGTALLTHQALTPA